MLTRLRQRRAERRMERLIARRTRIDHKLHRMGAQPGWLSDRSSPEDASSALHAAFSTGRPRLIAFFASEMRNALKRP